MRERKSKVIIGLDSKGNPIYAKQGLDKEVKASDELTRRIKEMQKILDKEKEEQE